MTIAVTKLIIQIPCLNEAADAAGDARRSAAQQSRASTSSRCWSSTTGRATAPSEVARALRRRSRRAASPQQGAGGGVHGRHRRVPQGRRRLHRQHRRRQPVRRRTTSRGCSRRCCAARPTSCIGDRNIAELRAHVVAQAAAAAARQLGRAAGVEHDRARHDERLPRLHARGGAADDDRLGVLLHARVDHPGRQEADGDRARAGRDQPAHARVAPVRQRLLVHQAIGARRSSASTRCTSR